MTAPVFCDRHPTVETELRCGRCERPICPRCMVHTPGGIRCPDCAQLRRPVMYELGLKHYVIAVATAAAVGAVLGIAAAFLLPVARMIPFFGFMIAILAGVGAGGLMGEALTRTTRGKRGTAMQLIAAAGLGSGWLLRLMLIGGLGAARGDLLGILAFIIAAVAAWQRLR